MKHKTIIILFAFILLSKLLSSQNERTNLISVFANIIWDTNNNPYPLKVHNGNDWNGLNMYEYPLRASYYKSEISFKKYAPFEQHQWYFITELGIGMDNYESTLYYGNYNRNGIWSQASMSEKIAGIYFHTNIGIGKLFYLGKNQKLSLIPEATFGFETCLYDKTVSASSNKDQKYFGDAINLGSQINLSIYYRIYKKIGVGISFDKLISAYQNYVNDEDQNPTITKFKWSIGKNIIHPRIGFVVYL